MSNLQRFSEACIENNFERFCVNKSLLSLITGFVAGVIVVMSAQVAAHAQLAYADVLQ
jgi:hypothetical protein